LTTSLITTTYFRI